MRWELLCTVLWHERYKRKGVRDTQVECACGFHFKGIIENGNCTSELKVISYGGES